MISNFKRIGTLDSFSGMIEGIVQCNWKKRCTTRMTMLAQCLIMDAVLAYPLMLVKNRMAKFLSRKA